MKIKIEIKMKIKFQEREIKRKCSIDKRTILLKFFPTFPTKFYHWNVYSLVCNNLTKQNFLR